MEELRVLRPPWKAGDTSPRMDEVETRLERRPRTTQDAVVEMDEVRPQGRGRYEHMDV